MTEFEDHIFVAMDAEAILFLHDLVTNYLKEKDRGKCSSLMLAALRFNYQAVRLFSYIIQNLKNEDV